MCFYLRNWQVTFLLYTLGVFISEYTAKAFTEPRDYRVVFLIQKTNKIPLKSCSLMTHVLFHPKIFLICSTASIFRNRRAVRAEPDLVLRLPDHLQKRSAESFLFLPKSQTEITLFSSHLLWHYLLVSFKTFIPDFPFVNTYPRSHPIMYV